MKAEEVGLYISKLVDRSIYCKLRVKIAKMPGAYIHYCLDTMCTVGSET